MRKARIAVAGVLALVLAGVPVSVSATAAGPPGGVGVESNAVLRWNRLVLGAVRATATAPTVAARALAMVHTCMYDAWAAYDPVAEGTRLGGALRRPPEERTPQAKREAVSRAAHHAAADLFPSFAADFAAALTAGGYDPAPGEPTPGTPAGVARAACGAVLEYRHRDGSNQLGDEPGSTGGPYSDWTGYQPVNNPDTVRDPDRWQPLRTPDGEGGETVQRFVTPHWDRVVPFAPGDSDLVGLEPGPPRAGTAARREEVDEVIRLSAALTDEQKVIAEYWADGPGTEAPPGHWMLFGQVCSRRDALGLDSDVKLFFVLANAMLDASIGGWARKRHFDSIRPISLIRLTHAGKDIRAWGGPHRGTEVIDGADWRPYLPTPPFGEYTSGHSTFSAAGAEVLRLFTGRDDFGASVVVPAGSSGIEPGTVPARDVVLHWATFSEAADQAGFSRRLGGIHFVSGDLAGRLSGRRIGARVMARAQEFFAGVSGVSGVSPARVSPAGGAGPGGGSA